MQSEKAELFRKLHQGPETLLVGSAWDPGSAVVFEKLGFSSIATSSAGIAHSLGYADGERLPLEEMLSAIHRIAHTVEIPVSADLESGFGRSSQIVAETCKKVIDTGAVGVNLEDSFGSGALEEASNQAEKIKAVRAVSEQCGVPLVINARTDGYWLKTNMGPKILEDTIYRAKLYFEAGADCVFVPGVIEKATIARLVKAVKGPLNILLSAGAPTVADLAALGVRRVSQGSGPARAALSITMNVARELLEQGTNNLYTGQDTITYVEANQLFERGR